MVADRSKNTEAIVAIAAGYDHSIALAFTSSVYATGSDRHGQLGNTPSATKIPTQRF